MSLNIGRQFYVYQPHITYIIDASFLTITMGKGASISQATSAIFFEVAAHSCLVFYVGHLLFIVAFVAKVSVAIPLIVVLLLTITISLLITGRMSLTLQGVTILLWITDLVTLAIAIWGLERSGSFALLAYHTVYISFTFVVVATSVYTVTVIRAILARANWTLQVFIWRRWLNFLAFVLLIVR